MRFLNVIFPAVLALICATQASAQSVTFNFDNEYTQEIGLEFYSIDRNHVWPGGDEVWVLAPTDGVVSYPLQCQAGETICFGAWTQANDAAWGGGMDMEFNCNDCCAVCDGRVLDVIELN